MKRMVLSILTILLITLTLASAQQGPTVPRKQDQPVVTEQSPTDQLTLVPMTENNEESPFFNVTINEAGELTPLIWLCEVDLRQYYCALGKAQINPDILISNKEITAQDMQKAGVILEARKDALAKLQKYLGKNFFMEFSVYRNSIYSDKKWVYMVGMVPIKTPISLAGLPDYLKRSDGHALALIMEGRQYGHKSIYALGLAQANPKRDNWNKVLDLAFKNAEQKLARFVGVKNPAVYRRKWSNPGQMQAIAWAICEVQVE